MENGTVGTGTLASWAVVGVQYQKPQSSQREQRPVQDKEVYSI